LQIFSTPALRDAIIQTLGLQHSDWQSLRTFFVDRYVVLRGTYNDAEWGAKWLSERRKMLLNGAQNHC
jgi:hypothetical protein